MLNISGMLQPDAVSLEISNSGKFQLKSITSKISILTGTVAHGGTIPLPSGYIEGQCKWMVSVNSIDGTGSNGAFNNISCSADGTRVVTCQANRSNWVDGAVNTNITGTANYIIIGVK